MNVDLDSKKVGFVTLTVGHWDLMPDLMASIYQNYRHPKEFFIIPNQDFSLSVSAAINKGVRRALSEGCDYVCYVADDVRIGEGSVQTMIGELESSGAWVAHAHSDTESGYFFWVAKPQVFEEVGYWDENFYPAYFEDNDWDWRIRLRSPDKVLPLRVPYVHLGSVTVKRMDPERLAQHHRDFERNKQRYISKWGGEPSHERYTEPWGGVKRG